MERPLRVLLVEDSPDDALLLERQLRRGGYAPTIERVDSASQLNAALAHPDWDVVITDHNMPGFSAEAALELVRESGLDAPVIIVSGSIGEEIAVAAMKAGAADYIMKNNLSRLVPAIERELREASIRREHRRAEATIRHLAYHDPLTGLVNRHQFEQRLIDALRTPGPHALLYLDLDQFKVVNDTCGHVAGDELLKNLSTILHAQVREHDTLARLGGDEFGLLLENCPQARAKQIAEKLLRAINDFRFTWAERSFSLGGSIGLVPISGDNLTVSDLLRRADIACYAAKDRGRNRVHVYAEDDADLARRHGEMLWVSRINAALEDNRFELYRQHIVPLAEGGTTPRCCEILIRMRDEEGRLIAPGAFLPAAERYNLAPAIDRWVVRRLLESLSAARLTGATLPETVFVNISGTTLNDDSFFEFVREQLVRTAMPTASLCFEITETAAVANLSRAVEFIESFRRQGCHFALDDFGAGLSSFSYLKAIPVDYLKIDGAFVRDIHDDPMDRAIVESINHIGHVVGLKTVAEFVETPTLFDTLRDIGVDFAQGFGLHQPEPLLQCFKAKPA